MKRVLYVTNITAPYRLEFFNQLSKKVKLTVVFEKRKSKNRNETWFQSKDFDFECFFLDGINVRSENSFSFKLFRFLFSNKYDEVIFGCYNSPVQSLGILLMRLFHKKYIISFDGIQFLVDNEFKTKVKTFIIKGASLYLTAGPISRLELAKYVPDFKIISYNFSSLTNNKILENAKLFSVRNNNLILIVSQYLDVKGLDIAVEVAKLLPEYKFRFVGTGNRTQAFIEKHRINKIKNIEVVPFLKYEELRNQYINCKCLLAPSIRECWGLVINEAASFGTPIVSTWGCGAAVEFLSENYPQLLAEKNSIDSLYVSLKLLLEYSDDQIREYCDYLFEKSKEFTIEISTKIISDALNSEVI